MNWQGGPAMKIKYRYPGTGDYATGRVVKELKNHYLVEKNNGTKELISKRMVKQKEDKE